MYAPRDGFPETEYSTKDKHKQNMTRGEYKRTPIRRMSRPVDPRRVEEAAIKLDCIRNVEMYFSLIIHRQRKRKSENSKNT